MSEDLLYEEIYQKTQNCGRTQFVKLLQQNQIKIEQLQQENNILTEFEKWLEEEIKQKQNSLQFWKDREPREIIKLEKEIPILKVCLDKLQELKEGKNEKNNK